MSNALAIAAVTATLRRLLSKGLNLADDRVTIKSLDTARAPNSTTEQVNLFLYHVTYDAAWLNMNMPNQIKPNETAFPPLPLILHYLITVYGDDGATPESHALLGKAMSVMHAARALLSTIREFTFKTAKARALRWSDLP